MNIYHEHSTDTHMVLLTILTIHDEQGKHSSAAISQLLSGLLLTYWEGYSLIQLWLKAEIGFYLIAGLRWLPTV